jgi:O-antigen/teichoic acid export membrane protein
MLNSKIVFKSPFLRGIIALASSNTLAQVIPFLIIPFLTRLYSPSDFGFVATLIAISSILSVFASGKFELALVLTRNQEERKRLFFLCFFILALFTSLMIIIICLLFIYKYIFIFSFELDRRYLFLPLVVLLTGISNIFYNYLNSEKKFKELALSSIVYSMVNNSVALVFFFVSSAGLIIGEIIGRVSLMFYLNKSISDRGLSMKYMCLSFKENIDLIKKYRKFPLYTIPSEFLDVYAKQIPVYLMSFLNLTSSLGLYALTDKVLNKPISIVGRAVAVSFRVRASEDFTSYKNCRPILLKTLALLIALSFLPFTILYLYSVEIFTWFFGEEWSVAGVYAKILIPVFFMQFITSPLTYIFHIAGKQKVDLYLHIFMAFSLTLCFLYGYYSNGGIEGALLYYAYTNGVVYFLYLLFSIKFSKRGC